ncbi:MAG: chromosomal replication initiator protein DnaA, partial [Patescibacteria group bacterium]|nr:chromosomal replication initiator protein DnaA [Patescibacteria group bacterium]
VGIPNEFVRQWIVEKHHKTLLRLLRERIEGVRSIEYIIVGSQHRVNQTTTPVSSHINGKNIAQELPFAEYYVSKEDNLNPRYTFETFVIGSFNELAHAASQAVIKKPGVAYNPLFIYGNTGRGKTHLIQAIGNALKRAHAKERVYYITSEQFATEYVDSLQNGTAGKFKEKYRGYNTVLIDDIQFFSKKEKIQEELFHLYNTMHDSNRQVIFSSDTHPSQLPDIESRLLSRFAAGMVVEITEPDYESRMLIIRKKMQGANAPVSEDVITTLADSITANIRELEGAMNSILCEAKLHDRAPNLLDVKQYIKNNVRPKKTMAAAEVIKTIASYYGIEESSIYEKTRRKEVVKPRQVIMYILREDFQTSYPTIGQRLGGRDHTTVIHSCDKVKEGIKTNMEFAQEINQIRAILK